MDFTRALRGQHRPIPNSASVGRDGQVLVQRPDDQDRVDPERLTRTHLKQAGANGDLREIAEFLISIAYLHLVPQHAQ